jgi:uncharacterized protein (TIGR03546 family)
LAATTRHFHPTLSMFWLKIIKDFIKILREGQTPAQIAGGFALGSLLGFSPMLTLQGLVIWLVIFSLNVNLASAFLSVTLCSLFAYLLDPLFHLIGYFLLVQIDGLRPFWTTLYNAPIAPLTRFNNTIVMGSLAVALAAFLPMYIGMKRFVIAYRSHVGSKIEQSKIYKTIKKSTLVQWYLRIRDMAG